MPEISCIANDADDLQPLRMGPICHLCSITDNPNRTVPAYRTAGTGRACPPPLLPYDGDFRHTWGVCRVGITGCDGRRENIARAGGRGSARKRRPMVSLTVFEPRWGFQEPHRGPPAVRSMGVHQYGKLGRDSPSRAGRRAEQAWSLSGVRSQWRTLKRILQHAEPAGYQLHSPAPSVNWTGFCRSFTRSSNRIGRLPRSSGTRPSGIFERLQDEHSSTAA